jgi:hypothetical protein
MHTGFGGLRQGKTEANKYTTTLLAKVFPGREIYSYSLIEIVAGE